jgi:aspartyl-tRNA(Asn)/glutamyl-tRNA(Gln) amidotransferase subunit A
VDASAVRTALDRIDPALGAFITVDADAALRSARAAPRGRLAGVPIAVKDLIDVAGMRTTYGSPRYADHVPDRTAPAVGALLAEGAVVIGKTNLNEFAYGVTGYNPHFGAILSPRDRTRTAGGSSGGSAAAVAAGVCRLAVGTDTSGSIRIPAACCGIWGLKLGHGAADMTGVFPLCPSYDSLGYLADGPDLLRLALGIDEPPDPRTLRVGVIGADLEMPALPAEHWTIFRAEAWQTHGRAVTEHPEDYGADLRARFALVPEDPAAARAVMAAWRRAYAAAAEGYDVLVDIVMDGLAPLLSAARADYEGGTFHVRERLLRHTPAANALGWPALAFPTAAGPRQVLGRDPAALLAVATRMAAATAGAAPGPTPPP